MHSELYVSPIRVTHRPNISEEHMRGTGLVAQRDRR